MSPTLTSDVLIRLFVSLLWVGFASPDELIISDGSFLFDDLLSILPGLPI